MWEASLSFFPLGPLYMCVLHCSEGKRGMSIVGSLPVQSVDLAQYQRRHLRQRHWTKLNCWTQDYWLFGSKVEYVTPLAHLQDLPQLNWHCLILSHHHYQCQEKVQLFCWTVGIFTFCLAGSFYNNTHTHTHTHTHDQVVTGNEKISLLTLSLTLSQKCEKKLHGPFYSSAYCSLSL